MQSVESFGEIDFIDFELDLVAGPDPVVQPAFFAPCFRAIF